MLGMLKPKGASPSHVSDNDLPNDLGAATNLRLLDGCPCLIIGKVTVMFSLWGLIGRVHAVSQVWLGNRSIWIKECDDASTETGAVDQRRTVALTRPLAS